MRAIGWLLAVYVVTVALVVWWSGDSDYNDRLHQNVVNDITALNPVPMGQIVTPRSVDEIVAAINMSSGAIAIGGGRFSMGGQTAIDAGLQLDMREFDRVATFDPANRVITVQSGMSWRELQEIIDPYDLSVKIMQTYANFTVGGSLSVNVHGRYIGHGPVISSVRDIQLVLADGQVVLASRDSNPDLFHAAIGGYGGVGVISEITLELAENEIVGRQTRKIATADYREHFMENVRDNDQVVFHNADMYPPYFDEVRDVSWMITDEPLTIEDRLIAKDDSYWLLPKMISFSNSSGFGKWAREAVIDPLFYASDRVARRNWEASYDVRELGEGDRSEKTWVLQEYFIPVENFDSFVPKMRDIFRDHDVDVVNVSVRHALPDTGSFLSWARNEVFAFVVYHSQGTTDEDKENVGIWTRKMIDAIVSEGGAYYLPYQLHATRDQFLAAYPNADKYFAVKALVDPDNRFQNKLWEKYYPTKDTAVREYLDNLPGYKKGEEQTLLTLPEWYLVFNPNEYADFLESGNNPSDFPFIASIDEYWTLFDRVSVLTKDMYPHNAEYRLMLWVIGISTSAEFVAKGLYENTIGRLTRWSASGDTAEDVVIQEAHRAYAELLDVEPWYAFDFAAHVNKIWRDTSFFGADFLRKTERKLLLSMEFGIKAGYAKLIGYGATATSEEKDGLVTMHIVSEIDDLAVVDPRIRVLRNFGDGHLVVTVPRWGPFTEIMPKLAHAGVRFVEISGNDEILFTAVGSDTDLTSLAFTRLLFESAVISPQNLKRSVFIVRIENLHEALLSLQKNPLKLEHIFDF